MKTQILKNLRRLSVLCGAVLALGRPCSAQTAPVLDVQLHATLSITGTVGRVHLIQYVSSLEQANNPSAWRCLEFLQLPASPYLWTDRSGPATGQRFYRAVVRSSPPSQRPPAEPEA